MVKVSTATTSVDGGFCKCDIATGWVKTYSANAVGTAAAHTGTGEPYTDAENAPCLPAAFAPGLDYYTNDGSSFVGDECWGKAATAYAHDAALKLASSGCIKSATTGFAVCWEKPPYTGIVNNSWNGKCIPACYKFGQ